MNHAAAKLDADINDALARRTVIRLDGIVKRFGALTVLDDIDLEIGEGEFFSLLGPSGSGKTTLLRLISGFDRPDGGTLLLDGIDVANAPAHRRDVNTVFQDYALFPHMTVLENVAYGPLARKASRHDAVSHAHQALEMVKLDHLGQRRPGQLSGGQRQRVAMARAIVNRPRVLLLDEPLGALDLKLRHEMQFELKHFQRELGITFVYVTHDQEEAVGMSDRIAVFEQGRIAQSGTPTDLYERPANKFVASFVGTSNIITHEGATVMLRPERIRLHCAPPASGAHVAKGIVTDVTYLGPTTRFLIAQDDGISLQASVVNGGSDLGPSPSRGDAVWAVWNEADMVRLHS